MKKQLIQIQRGILLAVFSFLCVISINAQTWTAPALTGSTPASGTAYYMYNVGSNGYLTAGGNWGTQANVSAQPRANASTSVVKWTATNTTGSMWSFQYNLAGSNQTDCFLCASDPTNGDVFTDAYDVAGRTPNRPWTVALTDATNKIYSIQVRSTYGGYVASQYFGSATATESTNDGIANTVRYNRASGDSYTKWKFVSQADLDLYNARILLDKYMTYAKKKAIDISSYITTYNAGVTASINSAAATLLTALGRTDVTASITNPSFETNNFTGWTNNGFQTQSNVPGQGWTKAGTYYCESWINAGQGWATNLSAGSITQTVSGLSGGLYELVVSGHAVQQVGANPLHTGAYITAGAQTTEVVAGKDYSISDITVSGSTLTIGYSLVAPIACNWTGFDNLKLYYYGPLAITLSKTQFAFIGNDNYLSDNLTVTGANLSGAISISAPTGITVNPTSLPSNAVNATVTVTYDGTTTVNGNITFTSGTTTANVAVTASPNTGCFTPLYPSGNIITDPYCNSYLADGWGTKSINTNPTYVYCGSSSAYINGGSVDRALNGTNGNAQMLPNTTYRVKAKVWKVSGTVGIGVYGWSGEQSYIFHEVTTAGSWQDVDFTFTSGATLGGSQGVYFNSGEGYIDNWEMYVLDVTIPSGTLTINQNVTVQNGLTIVPGAALILNSGNTLTVKGDLAINSDATGTGTYIDNGTTTATNVHVQQYLTGGTPNSRYWYLTSPVVGSTSNAFTPAINYLWSYSEAGNDLASVYTLITATNTPLTPGTGYVARMIANGNISLAGTSLFNNNKTFTNLSFASTDATKKGFNLIGNPYPCYLDITTAFTGAIGFETTAWYRSSADGTSNVFDTFNASTGAGITLISGVNTATLAKIPPMQAFWVRVTNTTNSLTFSKSARSNKPDTNGNNLRSADTSDVKQIRLNVSNGTNTDQTLIGFYAQAMDEFENCDSRKMFNGVANLPEIYTLAGSTIVAINGLPLLTDTREIALGFKTAQAGSFTIKAAEIVNLEADQTVILKDKQLNVSQNLTDQPVYSFSSNAVNTTSRFSIVIGKMVNALTFAQKTTFDVRTLNNGQMEIALDGATQASVKVFDAVGKLVFTQDILSQTSPLSKTFSKGVYLVKVSIGGVEDTKKVVINL